MTKAARQWWEARWVAAIAVLAVAVPLLWPSVPPLVDLPTHMASYYVSLNLHRSPELQRYFGFAWQLIGNLGVDLLIVPVGKVIGVEAGSKLIAVLIPTLTALGFVLIAREGHRRMPPTAFAALPLAYNYPLMFGFVNYCLVVALAMLGFALWLRLSRTGQWRFRAAAFLVIACATWLAHAIGWTILLVMCGTAELQRRLASRDGLVRPLAETALACLPLLAPLVLIAMGPHERGGAGAAGWFQWFMMAKWSLTLLRDRWMVFDMASAGLIALLIGPALLRVGGLRFSPVVGWPALALALLYVVAPQEINGSEYVSARIVPYAAALAILAIDAGATSLARQRLLAAASAVFLAVRLAGNLASFALYDASYTRELAALDHIPRGAAVLTLSGVPCRPAFANWYNSRLYHLPGLAVVRRQAFINSTWSIHGLQLLRVHYDAAGPYRSDPSEFVHDGPCPNRFVPQLADALAQAPLHAFSRVWLIDVSPRAFPSIPRLRLLWSSSSSAVYEVAPAPSPDQAG